jgi:hypothetical protein
MGKLDASHDCHTSEECLKKALRKGKPGESRGRKALGLKFSNKHFFSSSVATVMVDWKP